MVGVMVEAGIVKPGTPLTLPSKEVRGGTWGVGLAGRSMGGWALGEEHGRVGLEGRSMGGWVLRGGAWEGGS